MWPKGVFVLGGAASGKSAWAERLLENRFPSIIYLATGQAFDTETETKINLHKKRRDHRWRTVEAPVEVAPVLAGLSGDEAVLIDCATMWLNNLMMGEHDLADAQSTLIDALKSCPAPWVIVSNEVGQGIVPQNALARQFREAQGRLNIALAQEAELAVQVIAGLPQVLKGQLP